MEFYDIITFISVSHTFITVCYLLFINFKQLLPFKKGNGDDKKEIQEQVPFDWRILDVVSYKDDFYKILMFHPDGENILLIEDYHYTEFDEKNVEKIPLHKKEFVEVANIKEIKVNCSYNSRVNKQKEYENLLNKNEKIKDFAEEAKEYSMQMEQLKKEQDRELRKLRRKYL